MKSITSGYLLQLSGGSYDLRYSTLGEFYHDSTLYKDGLVISSVSQSELDFSLPNFDLAFSTLILNNGINGFDVTLWSYEKPAPIITKKLFVGKVVEVPNIADRVQIRALSGSSLARVPNKVIAAPTFNHLMPAESTIKFGDLIYKIVGRK